MIFKGDQLAEGKHNFIDTTKRKEGGPGNQDPPCGIRGF
jgi:hypothetical protein